jgi:alkyl hydroperoxide reductase subunit AhpC
MRIAGRPGRAGFQARDLRAGQGDFGEITLEGLKKAKKWTVLFFYPADFTFV